jgi:hypothetical protein
MRGINPAAVRHAYICLLIIDGDSDEFDSNRHRCPGRVVATLLLIRCMGHIACRTFREVDCGEGCKKDGNTYADADTDTDLGG